MHPNKFACIIIVRKWKLEYLRNHKVLVTDKEIEFLQQTLISNPSIFATQCCKPLIFQTMNFVRFKQVWNIKGLHDKVAKICVSISLCCVGISLQEIVILQMQQKLIYRTNITTMHQHFLQCKIHFYKF